MTPLATKDLVHVKRELGPFARWKGLGLNLGISPESLEVIENDYRQTDDQLEAVLLHWLEKDFDRDEYGLPSWRRLAEAVKPIDHALSLTIQDRHPSCRISKEHLLHFDPSQAQGSSPTSATPTSSGPLSGMVIYLVSKCFM